MNDRYQMNTKSYCVDYKTLFAQSRAFFVGLGVQVVVDFVFNYYTYYSNSIFFGIVVGGGVDFFFSSSSFFIILLLCLENYYINNHYWCCPTPMLDNFSSG